MPDTNPAAITTLTDNEYDVLESTTTSTPNEEQSLIIDKDALSTQSLVQHCKISEAMTLSGLLVSSPLSFKLWDVKPENWLGYMYEPDFFTHYHFASTKNVRVDYYSFHPTTTISANFSSFYQEFVIFIRIFDSSGGITKEQLYRILEKHVPGLKTLVPELVDNPFDFLADKHYTLIQKLMDYKKRLYAYNFNSSKEINDKYNQMLKDPKTKQLVLLYDLLDSVSVYTLPIIFIYGSNFFGNSGNLDKNVVSSQETLEEAYNCFKEIIKLVEKHDLKKKKKRHQSPLC